MITRFLIGWSVCVWMFNFWIRPTSTTLTVTVYDGTGIVQQQPLTLFCNFTDGGSNVVFSWRQETTIILSGNVDAQTVRFQEDTDWKTSGIFMGDYTSSFTIQLPASSVTPGVAGQYTCIVSSLTEAAQDTATATVHYTPQIKSTFPSSRTVTELSHLQIDCSSYTTPGNPRTTSYTWTYEGSTISSGAVLDINNIGRDRRGQYTCTASNTVGSDSETVSVDVQYGPGNSVQVTPEGTTALVEGSGPFTATCTADCNPDCSISWRSDTRNLNSVSISNVSRTDQGNYTCQAQNGIGGPREKTITLVVFYAPQIETTFPSSRTVTEFSLLQIDCSSYTTPGNPPTTSYTWTYGRSTISSGGVLDINNIGRDKRGQYTCTASNTFTPTGGSQQQGLARATVIVDVQYGPGNSVQVTPEGTTALVEGSGLFTATCTADCNPDCSISWRSDTRNLNSVSISNVSRTDQGNYTCQAQNRIGGPREKTTTLVVYYLDRPDLLLDKTEVVENETVILICNVESNPTAELEIKNEDNDTVLVERDTNRLQFTIDRVQCLHNGSLLCTARNNHIGGYSANRNLNVLCSPRQDFRHKLDNIVARLINESAALVADIIAYPVPVFRWFRQESGGLTNISRDTIHSISNSRLQSVLYINISRTQDYGVYVLEIENSQGRKQLLFTLTSIVPPSPPLNFKVVGTSHDTVSLSWKSNFNGVSPQTFTLQYHDAEKKDWKLRNNGIPDPGKYETITENITGLEANTLYYFAVFGTNVFGDGRSVFVNRTTERLPFQPDNTSMSNSLKDGLIASVVIIVCLLTVLVLGVVFLYRRGVIKKPKKNEDHKRLTQSLSFKVIQT